MLLLNLMGGYWKLKSNLWLQGGGITHEHVRQWRTLQELQVESKNGSWSYVVVAGRDSLKNEL